MHPMILRVDLELGDRQEMDREKRYNLKMNYKVGNSICRQCSCLGNTEELGALNYSQTAFSLSQYVCVNLGQE